MYIITFIIQRHGYQTDNLAGERFVEWVQMVLQMSIVFQTWITKLGARETITITCLLTFLSSSTLPH